MCLILLAYKAHEQYPLVVTANRDEFYDRPALPAGYWPDYPGLLGGRDLEKMGTWLGITVKGRFAAVTNYRDPSRLRDDVRSRGEIVSGFLQGNENPWEYINKIQKQSGDYNGFNLILADLSCCLYYSSVTNMAEELKPGVHGISNHLLNTPWPKIVRGREKLTRTLQDKNFPDKDRLFEILADNQKARDEELPDTGIGMEMERLMSPIFIKSSDYGTRSSTVLLIDRDLHAVFMERSKTSGEGKWLESFYEFSILQSLGGEK